jgi:hypothetical protein
MATGAKFGGHVAVRRIAHESLGKAEGLTKTFGSGFVAQDFPSYTFLTLLKSEH